MSFDNLQLNLFRETLSDSIVAVIIASPTNEEIDARFTEGFVRVRKDAFYAVLGKLDVTPYPQGRHDRVFGYRCEWKLRSGLVIGECLGGTTYMESEYAVSGSFFEGHRKELQ